MLDLLGNDLRLPRLGRGRGGGGGGGGPGPSVDRPYTVAVIGDSFGQRGQDITASPNSVDAGNVDPQLQKWATDLTTRTGGVQWGFSTWLDMLSGGKFTAPYQLNRAIGGFNTGQWARFDGADPTPWYLADFISFIQSPAATVFGPDAVIYQCGTNDGVTTFTPAQSYANIVKTCQKLVEAGLPVFVSTVPPRGNAAFAGSRIATDRIAVTNDLNALLIADLEDEPALLGKVRVIDPRASLYDPARVIGTTTENDVLASLTYDGLHLNADGCRVYAQTYLAAMNSYFPLSIADHLPTGATYIANGLMTGTAGTVTRIGNGATNTGFTISGTAPDGWTVTTTLNGGASGWNGTNPNNIKGTVTVASEAAAVGNAIVATLACDGSTLTNANTRALEATCAVTLPDLADLAVGEYFCGIAVVELSGHAGIRGVSAELRVTEPDAVLRLTRSGGPAPNGTANMTLDSAVDFTGAGRLVLQTPPMIRKAGSYGAIAFSVILMVAGQANPINAVVKISQAGVRKKPDAPASGAALTFGGEALTFGGAPVTFA